MSTSDIIDIAVQVVRETDKAFGVTEDGEAIIWLPKSQVEWDEDASTMAMPEWLAKEKELI